MENQLTQRYQHTLHSPIYFAGEISVTVTRDPQVVQDWITHAIYSYLALPLRAKLIYLAVLPEESIEVPHLLQMLIPRHCLCFYLSGPVPNCLQEFLLNRLYTFVGSDVNSSLQRLQQYYGVGGNALRNQQMWHFRHWPWMVYPREYELQVPCPPPYQGNIQSTITHNQATVTQWITRADAHLSLPTVEPKIVYLAVFLAQPFLIPAVLQILVDRQCLFFQIYHAPGPYPDRSPDSLRNFLANKQYIFAGSYTNIRLAFWRLHSFYSVGDPDRQRMELKSNFPDPNQHCNVISGEISNDQIVAFSYEGFAGYQKAMAPAAGT